MNYKWVKMPQLGYSENFELNVPTCRVFHGLSENPNIIEILPLEQKLWQFEKVIHKI